MATKQRPPVSFRGPVERDLEQRAREGVSLGQVAERDLMRYYYLLGESLRSVELTEGEALAILDTLNSTLVTPESIDYLWIEIEDACKLDGLEAKWEIDGPALVAKLREYTPLQCAAICDAAERAWATANQDRSHSAWVRRVGLVR